ncbi:aspartic proteinase 36-like [Prosopis cineraria]|uniref:aspartic proteinase 36-like n=1 Tax=Prosopis cineraria TaxID=364024 RepID=UPI00241041F2|nr:aspartic proteinase 36-like [Prosopis cineraria]
MAATLPVGILMATIALFFCQTTTVICEFPMTLPLERAIPLRNEMKLSELKALDHARHRRLIQSSNDTDFPLEGTYDPYVAGLYYTKVQLGSPPRDFHLQVDTGSDPLWVTCSSCSGCPHKTQLQIKLSSFDPGKSSTYSPVTCSDAICSSEYQTPEAVCSSDNRCTYTFQYADDSASAGYYVSDLIYFATAISNGSSPLIFGCSKELTGNLVKNERGVDGIIGFGQGDISVVSQLSSKGLVPKVFSHCLRGDDQGGGTLVLGEIVEPNIVFTPLIPSWPHYNLDLKGIEVKGQKLAIDSSVFQTLPNQGTVIDSGTTMAYLPEGVYESFLNAVSDAVPVESLAGTYVADGSQCFFTLNSISEVFPNISLNFAGGASMVLKPKDYLVHHMTLNDGETGWCIGIQKMQGSQGFTILGDIVLKDRIIVYDLAGQRIGWADYDCSKSFNVSVKLTSASGSSSVGTSTDWPLIKKRTLAFFVSLICCFLLF